MNMSKSGLREIEAACLKLSGELTALADDLAQEAHSNIGEAKLYEALLGVWQSLGDIHEEYSAKIDTLYAKHFRV